MEKTHKSILDFQILAMNTEYTGCVLKPCKKRHSHLVWSSEIRECGEFVKLPPLTASGGNDACDSRDIQSVT